MSSRELTASGSETVEALLAKSGRDGLSLHSGFVRSPEHAGAPGPLAAFVTQRRAVALDLYLLGSAVASSPDCEVVLSSSIWARALGLAPGPGAAATISRSWSWIEGQGLVATARRGKLRAVRFVDEGGSGDAYFKLPYAYWRAEYATRLGLPAKALLLVLLSKGGSFTMTPDRGARLYGLSRDTVSRGVTTLVRLGVAEFSEETRKSPLSPRGSETDRTYRLRAPFGEGSAERRGGVAARRRRQREAAGVSRVEGP